MEIKVGQLWQHTGYPSDLHSVCCVVQTMFIPDTGNVITYHYLDDPDYLWHKEENFFLTVYSLVNDVYKR